MLNIELSHDPATVFLGTYKRELKTMVYTKLAHERSLQHYS